MLEYFVGELSRGEGYLAWLLETMSLIPPGPTFEYAIVARLMPMIARTAGLVADRFDVAEAAADVVLSSPYAGPAFVMRARAGLEQLRPRQHPASAQQSRRPGQCHVPAE